MSSAASPPGSLSGHSKPSAREIYEQRKKYSTSNFIMADTSQYSVDHLVSFCMDGSDSVHTVEGAVSRLAVLDSKGKIWSQEMLLQVQSGAVTLIDIESQDELERYPLSAVQRCDSVATETRFHSLLLLVCQETSQRKPDVHFFNCHEVEADLIRDDITSAMSDFRTGKNSKRPNALRSNQERMSQQLQTPPQPPKTAPKPGSPYRPSQRKTPLSVNGKEHKDISVLRAEREVEILNHSFDDIESFLAKLQKSSEAFRVLDQRKKRKNTKKREAGEGLLTVRARPPSEQEFIGNFQKLKYCFSLLARLKNHIVNPNSTELVHFLFQPLEMMVNATGGPEVARGVGTPCLTQDAVTLLRDTLNEKEDALWRSLGENWTLPRSELPQDQRGPPYTPTFLSGWEPSPLDPEGIPWEDPVELQHKHEALRLEQSTPPRVQPPTSNQSQVSISPVIPQHTESRSPDPIVKHVRCTYDFVARNSNELSVLQGDQLQVLDSSKRWWKCRNRYSQIGYVPFNILEEPLGDREGATETRVWEEEGKTPPPTSPKKSPRLNRGPAPQLNWDAAEGPPADPRERDHASQISVMNDELLLRIASGRTAPQRALHIPRSAETSAPLDYDSPPSEVRDWLEAKRFNEGTVSALGILTGAQIFSLNKDELRSVCPDEGARVYSQIMVQKALLEDARMESELESVMQKQKKKVEQKLESNPEHPAIL